MINKIIFLLLPFLFSQVSIAAETLRGGQESDVISEPQRMEARRLIEEKCNSGGFYFRVTGSQESCLKLAAEEQLTPSVVSFCAQMSNSQFVACLKTNKGLNIPERITTFCTRFREGDVMWSPRSDCARRLAVSKSSYNQRVFSDCYRFLSHSSQALQTCIDLIRDRNLEDNVFENCVPKTASTNDDWIPCLRKATETADPFISPCDPSPRIDRVQPVPKRPAQRQRSGSGLR